MLKRTKVTLEKDKLYPRKKKKRAFGKSVGFASLGINVTLVPSLTHT